jgi:aminoglycoside phosphotransferase (APT) family kinase protein
LGGRGLDRIICECGRGCVGSAGGEFVTGTERPRIHAGEIDLHDSTVRRLLSMQFPQWADLRLHRVPSTGTDNVIYRLGSDLGLRLPRIDWAVSQVEKEWQWLRRLAPELPAPVPLPLAKGKPGCGYPYPWLVYPWLEGDDLQHASSVDLNQAARDIASFVVALEQIELDDDRPQGKRAGSLGPLDEEARWAIGRLGDDGIDVHRAMTIWEAALRAEPWTKPPVWTHGDLLAANIIVRDGKLAGVIDWSCAGVGDPACDAQLAWFFPPESRAIYRDALGFSDSTWARARGWVVWQTAMFIPYYAATIPDAVATAMLRLQAVLDDSDSDPAI